MAIIGNTVKLRAEFHDYGGRPEQPQTVEVIIYNAAKTILTGPVALSDDHKVAEGVYEYPYTIPAGHDSLFYEFRAMASGFPAVARGMIVCDWQ